MHRILGLVILCLAACRSPARAPSIDPLKVPFDKVVEGARGTTVRWFFWSGDGTINRYVDEYVIPTVNQRFGITLVRVPVDDPAIAINRLLAEKRAGKTDGVVDLLWVNGENFRTGKAEGLFFGPFASRLPNLRFVDGQDQAVRLDFGVATDGYESPWNRAQFVFIYDTEKVPEPPRSLEALTKFIEANPGRFTYPAPPDFTGSAFLRHVLYGLAKTPAELSGPLDDARWSALSPRLFGVLDSWKPHLWQQGRTFPESSSRLHQLFAQGEVWLSMSYGPETASSRIREGLFPASTRTFMLERGTIANTNFVAIPFNSQNAGAAMVVADFLLSPEAQLKKQDPAVWGTHSVLDVQRLPPEVRAQFLAQPRGPATLSPAELRANALPELDPSWIDRLEASWREAQRAPH